MKRKELIESREYWIADIQLHLFEMIENFLKKNNMSQSEFAEKLGVTKGYVSQILNGDFDHKISKLVDLSLAVGMVPRITFQEIDDFMEDDIFGIEKIIPFPSQSIEALKPKTKQRKVRKIDKTNSII